MLKLKTICAKHSTKMLVHSLQGKAATHLLYGCVCGNCKNTKKTFHNDISQAGILSTCYGISAPSAERYQRSMTPHWKYQKGKVRNMAFLNPCPY
jgi:hypothetical protein